MLVPCFSPALLGFLGLLHLGSDVKQSGFSGSGMIHSDFLVMVGGGVLNFFFFLFLFS